LERRFLSQEIESRVSVRVGDWLAEVLAEYEQCGADAILVNKDLFRDAGERKCGSGTARQTVFRYSTAS
jgi:hypothetical protein